MADEHNACTLGMHGIISLSGLVCMQALRNMHFAVTERHKFVAESGCFAEVLNCMAGCCLDGSPNLYKEDKSDVSKTKNLHNDSDILGK